MKYINLIVTAGAMTYLINGFTEKYGFLAAMAFLMLTSVIDDFVDQRAAA